MSERNPQAAQMAHESMVRNLAAQAEAVWPQERGILLGHLPGGAPHRPLRVLDVGCGTGEALRRLARELPAAQLLGIDLHEPHLELARRACRGLEGRVEFRRGDAFELDLPAGAFDLTLCRHMLQAVPEPERVLAEMKRVTRPGGRLHVVAEDYGLILCHPCAIDAERFWRLGPLTLGERLGTDLRCGRKAFHWMTELDLEEVRVDWIAVDTVRVPRATLVQIFEAWRDGYTEIIAAHGDLAPAEVRPGFEAIIASFRDPSAYGAWLLPVVSGRKPA